MIHQRYELSSDTLELCKGKLVPGIAATWGEVTGNIENQKDLVSYISAHGGKAEWGSISGNLSDQTDLMGYMDRFATTAWVSEQNYLTSASLTGYATESWVSSQGYLVQSDLSQYATRQWVTGRGYVTESWVSSQGYLTASSLSGYIHFDESSPLSGIGKTLPFYGSTVGLFPVYQSLSSTWVNIEMTTDQGGWVSMGLACYDETGSSEIWRDRFMTENDMTGYVSRSYVDWSMQTQGYPFSVYTPADASGNYIIGSLDSSTQEFTGIKVSGSQVCAYTVISAGLQYEEGFSPLVTEDWIYDNEDILKLADMGLDWPNYPVIERPNTNQDGYNSEGYIFSLLENYDTIEEDGDDIERKIVNYLLCENQNLFQREFIYHDDDGEWVLQNEFEYQPFWIGGGWDAAQIHILGDDPEYQGKLDDFPVNEYFDIGWDKLPFGQFQIETGPDGEALFFNGFCWDQENEELGLYKVTPILVPGVGYDGYEEEFKAFALDDDLTTLASRVSALETNYGDALTTTNNILGV